MKKEQVFFKLTYPRNVPIDALNAVSTTLSSESHKIFFPRPEM